jgi:YesN/AraC family two-component response regulator
MTLFRSDLKTENVDMYLNKNSYFISILFILLGHFMVFAGNLDSLDIFTYQDLHEKINTNEDTVLSNFYTNKYINKAKFEKDSFQIAYGFYLKSLNLTNLSDEDVIEDSDLRYYDSIIKYTNKLKDNELFPSIAYFNKGKIFHRKERFKEALENYLIAIDRLNTKDSIYYHYINYTIADLKIRFNKHFEGLNILKSIYNYYRRNVDLNNVGYNREYLSVLFSISHSFSKQGMLDSAEYYSDLGYKKSIKQHDSISNYFLLSKGVLNYKRGKYKAAVDSIQNSLEGIKALEDVRNLSYAHHFLGMSHVKMGDKTKAITHFKKVDSIFSIIKDVNPDIKDGFKYLIEYAKSENKIIDQLHYTNQILKLDSIYYTNYMNIHTGIYEKIDREKLEAENKNLEKTVTWGKKRIFILYIVVGIVLFVVICVVFVARRRKKRYEIIYQELRKNERFEQDMIEDSPHDTDDEDEVEDEKEEIDKKKNAGLSDEFVNEILKKLDKFEERNEFLSNKVRLESLSKKLKTNSRYLSKIINSHKNRNFTQYINGLRVEYIIKELNSGSRYRRYTIEGIAEEIGFNNGESFSKAFHKKTGIYPSLFIKNLITESKK